MVLPSLLWHYTASVETVLAILGNSSLRLSNVERMNDAKELAYGYERFPPLIDEAEERARAKGLPIQETYRYLRSATSRNSLGAIYVVSSLSGSPDALSQYARYGRYSIGFRSDLLLALAKSQGVELVQCVYDPEAQRRLAEQVFAPIRDGIERHLSSDNFGPRWRAANGTAKGARFAFLQLACRLKHPGFAEEREWRLARLAGNTQLPTRETAYGTTRDCYLRWDDGRSPVVEIKIGPPEPEVFEAKLRTSLQGLPPAVLDAIRITRSEIPLRFHDGRPSQYAWNRLKAVAMEESELWNQVGRALLEGRRACTTDQEFDRWCAEQGFDMGPQVRSDAMWLAEQGPEAPAILGVDTTHPSHMRILRSDSK